MQKRNVLLIGLLFFAVLVVSGCCGSKNTPGKAEGTMFSEKVTVTGNVAYELALPPGLEPGRTYPLFFFLSPGASPKSFLPGAGPACSEFKCIFAGSYNYRNNAHPDTWAKPVKECIEHLIRTQPVDRERIFLAGFSGGAQASYVASFFNPGICRGILANSGVVHQNLQDRYELEKCQLKVVALMSGTTDNVVTPAHLKNDENLLKSAKIQTRLFSFSGGHIIAPADVYRQAIEWLLQQ